MENTRHHTCPDDPDDGTLDMTCSACVTDHAISLVEEQTHDSIMEAIDAMIALSSAKA